MPDVTLKKGGLLITLRVNGYEFSRFNNFRLSLNYNSIASQFSFDGFFDINNPAHKKLFKPLSYNEAIIAIDGRRVLTGTIINTSTSISGVTTLCGISGYSKPGVLEDVSIPDECYPLQTDNLTLKQIAEKLCAPFGIAVKVTDNLYPENSDSTPSRADLTTGNRAIVTFLNLLSKINEKITSTAAGETDSPKEYLTKLAKQRNLILTHDAYGNLVITKVNADKKSIATFTENKPSTNISLSVNGQGIHSRIKIVGQAAVGSDVAVENQINNPLITAFRPATKKQDSGTNNNTASASELARGSELSAISLNITTPDWYWTDGKTLRLILPNEYIDVISENNYMAKRVKWFVESVNIEGNESQTIASLRCVLPEVYTGKEPKNIFQ